MRKVSTDGNQENSPSRRCFLKLELQVEAMGIKHIKK